MYSLHSYYVMQLNQRKGKVPLQERKKKEGKYEQPNLVGINFFFAGKRESWRERKKRKEKSFGAGTTASKSESGPPGGQKPKLFILFFSVPPKAFFSLEKIRKQKNCRKIGLLFLPPKYSPRKEKNQGRRLKVTAS